MAPLIRIVRGLCVALLVMACTHNVYGQLPVAISFAQDSLVVGYSERFAYNAVTFQNTSDRVEQLSVRWTVPAGWQMVGSPIGEIQLNPFETRTIPVNLLNTPSARPSWSGVQVQLVRLQTSEEIRSEFVIRAVAVTKFRASAANESHLIYEPGQMIHLPVNVRNEGNTVNRYSVNWSSKFFNLDKNISFSLAGGKDTTCSIQLTASPKFWKALYKESVAITVKAGTGESVVNKVSISKVSDKVTVHPHAYDQIPIFLEAGASYMGSGEPVVYTGSVSGSVPVSDNSKVSFMYRPNQIAGGLVSNYSRPTYYADLQVGRLTLAGGTMSGGAGLFQSTGEGVRASYITRKGVAFDAQAMIYSQVIRTRSYNFSAHYLLKKNIVVTHQAAAESNPDFKSMSFLENNIIEYQGKKLRLSAQGGIGYTMRSAIVSDLYRKTYGVTGGYSAVYTNKRFGVNSFLRYSSPRMVGSLQGGLQHNSELRYSLSHFNVSGFYAGGYNRYDMWLDTSLVSLPNLGTYSSAGARAGFNTRLSSVTLTAAQRTQANSTADGAILSQQYGSLQYSYRHERSRSTLTMIGTYGQSSIGETNSSQFYSVQSNINTRWAGVSAIYTKGIGLYDNAASTQNIGNSRYTISPYLTFDLFKNTIHGRVQYTVNAFSGASQTMSSYMVNLSYDHYQSGTNLTVQLFVAPGFNGAISNHGFMTFRKQINLPQLARRKHYSVEATFFSDLNGNDTLDAADTVLPSLTIGIGDHPFVSNKAGKVRLRNADTGSYNINLGDVQGIVGLMPSRGPSQTMKVAGVTKYFVPFKKSRVITGNVRVINDSLSSFKFTPENLRVTAMSSDGNEYTTATDAEGNFVFNVPAGEYAVGLNPKSFSETFKPVQMLFNVNLKESERESVFFTIKQAKRQMNIIRKAQPAAPAAPDGQK